MLMIEREVIGSAFGADGGATIALCLTKHPLPYSDTFVTLSARRHRFRTCVTGPGVWITGSRNQNPG